MWQGEQLSELHRPLTVLLVHGVKLLRGQNLHPVLPVGQGEQGRVPLPLLPPPQEKPHPSAGPQRPPCQADPPICPLAELLPQPGVATTSIIYLCPLCKKNHVFA